MHNKIKLLTHSKSFHHTLTRTCTQYICSIRVQSWNHKTNMKAFPNHDRPKGWKHHNEENRWTFSFRLFNFVIDGGIKIITPVEMFLAFYFELGRITAPPDDGRQQHNCGIYLGFLNFPCGSIMSSLTLPKWKWFGFYVA